MTFIYDAAEEIISIGKPTYIYHFGDFDPSGVDVVTKSNSVYYYTVLRCTFKRVAITEGQIVSLNLPVRETKKSDPRAKNWGDKPSAELDALPAPILRQLVEPHRNPH